VCTEHNNHNNNNDNNNNDNNNHTIQVLEPETDPTSPSGNAAGPSTMNNGWAVACRSLKGQLKQNRPDATRHSPVHQDSFDVKKMFSTSSLEPQGQVPLAAAEAPVECASGPENEEAGASQEAGSSRSSLRHLQWADNSDARSDLFQGWPRSEARISLPRLLGQIVQQGVLKEDGSKCDYVVVARPSLLVKPQAPPVSQVPCQRSPYKDEASKALTQAYAGPVTQEVAEGLFSPAVLKAYDMRKRIRQVEIRQFAQRP